MRQTYSNYYLKLQLVIISIEYFESFHSFLIVLKII